MRLQKADLLTLRLLLCAAARNDHFCEGYLGSLAVDGKLLVVMQRLTEILADLHSGQMVWSLVNCGPLPDGQRGELASFDNFNRMYWADPGRLLAGDYPGDIDSEMAMQKLAYLVESGIGQVINLFRVALIAIKTAFSTPMVMGTISTLVDGNISNIGSRLWKHIVLATQKRPKADGIA